jgi:surface carbohydrate biosynthesis protein
MTKTLILPAEIMSREFDARLLQGVLALGRGWRVIVGSKALINRGIWRLPVSLYLCQTLTHKRLTMLRLLRLLGHVSYGWDEEGIIYLERDVYLMRRVSTDTLGLLSGLVAWGHESADDLNHRAKTVNLSARAMGNPRFDLLRPKLRPLYANEANAIRRAHGDFVLINTNFSSYNPVISLHDLPKRALSEKNKPTGNESKRFSELLAHRRKIFDSFLKDLPEFASQYPDLNFIVRPHPGEDMKIWNEAFRNCKNVKVIREGASIPWLIAAKALIHNGCTTAVEATIIGHTAIAYCPEVSLENESRLPNAISHRVLSVDRLGAAVKLAIANRLSMTGEQRAVLARYVSGISGPLATEAILDFCEEIHGSHSRLKASPVMRAAVARFFAVGRDMFKSRRKDYLTDRYLAKVFPPIQPEYVAKRANEMATTLNMKFHVSVHEVSVNIFELLADPPGTRENPNHPTGTRRE